MEEEWGSVYRRVITPEGTGGAKHLSVLLLSLENPYGTGNKRINKKRVANLIVVQCINIL